MAKVKDILEKRKGTPFASFEIVPPLKGSDISKLYGAITPLMEFAPPFINFTAHRDEADYRSNPDGSFTRVVTAKRPSTLAITAAITKQFKNVEVVPHVICGGFTADETENLLLDLHFLGIENVMALRGDAEKGEKYFKPTPGGYAHSSSLVKQIVNMNKGIYLDSDMKNPISTSFCIGVGGYPEKHIEAANLQEDIKNLKTKVDCGADYIITQMFFDNSKFFTFEKLCREAGITVPIIPGLKPISTEKQVATLPQAFAIDFPEDFVKGVKSAKSLFDFGIEWCIAQCKELIQSGVPAIHFYTMGKADNIRHIVEGAF